MARKKRRPLEAITVIAEPVRPEDITGRQHQIIQLVMAGKTVKEIMHDLEMTENAVYWQLSQPKVRLELERLRSAQLAQSRSNLVAATQVAVSVLTQILTNPDVHPRVRIEAAKEVLDRAGLSGVDKIAVAHIDAQAPDPEKVAEALERLRNLKP